MANGHGGARKGAGKPKGVKWKSTLTKEAARDLVRQAVIANMQPMIAAQVSHAQGLSYLVARDKTGKFKRLTSDEAEQALAEGGESEYTLIEVWEKDPSVQAFTDLMNRALDKPKEQEQDVNVKGDHVFRWAEQ